MMDGWVADLRSNSCLGLLFFIMCLGAVATSDAIGLGYLVKVGPIWVVFVLNMCWGGGGEIDGAIKAMNWTVGGSGRGGEGI